MNLKNIVVRPLDSGSPVTVKMGEGTPVLTSSGTGWVTKPRPRNVALVDFEGTEPITQDVPIMIDDFRRERGVEHILYALRSLAGIGRSDFGGSSPTRVKINGAIHFPAKKYVIDGIEEDPAKTIRLPHTGEITRYAGTLKLREWINPDQIRLRGPKRARFSPWSYTVKQGDTLTRIAQKMYGDAKYAKRLGDAQTPPIKDLRKKLKPGLKLKLPGFGSALSAAERDVSFGGLG